MEQGSTWEATSFSASQEVFRILFISLNFITANGPDPRSSSSHPPTHA
jgi:hypothetical protein